MKKARPSVTLRSAAALTLALGALPVLPAALRAQTACARTPALPHNAGAWAGPLHRIVALHVTATALRDVLAQLSRSAGVRLSYSTDLIPADRRVCVSWDGVPLGAALAALLDGLPVQALAAADDHIVLAARPRPALARSSVQAPLLFPLAPVHVRASALESSRGPLPVNVEIIEGAALRDAGIPTLAAAMNGVVPGLWIWSGASGFPTQFGSLRGASSFGPSAPRIFIDGIEVANPLLLLRLSIDMIERIEVMRGPQAAALFGANAMDGIANIVTRHDPAGGAPRFGLRSTLGLAATRFAPESSLDHEHSLRLSLGGVTQSAMLGLAMGGEGGSVPGGDNRYVSADGSFRRVGSHLVLGGTVRFLAQMAGSPASPLLPQPGSRPPPREGMAAASMADTSVSQLSVRQFTAGLRAQYAPGRVWTHSLVLGVDGYTLGGIDGNARRLASAFDSAWIEAGTRALRGTLRWSSRAQLDLGPRADGTLTFAADHTRYREYDEAPDRPSGFHPSTSRPGTGPAVGTESSRDVLQSSQNTTGFAAQSTLQLFDRTTLNAGLRIERNEGRIGLGDYAALPSFGGTVLASAGNMRLELRGAWGKGVRWPDVPRAVSSWLGQHAYVLIPSLGPEQQSGAEAGVDIELGRTFSLQLTRFDQTASGLIQPVAVSSSVDAEPWQKPGTTIVPQNVGQVSNRGWETQASLDRGALRLTAAASWVDSRVTALAPGYQGDLLPGDRMLGVPSRTLGLSARWTTSKWAATATVQRASDWVNYDRIALAAALDKSAPATPRGHELREFWRTYDGNTRLGLTFRHDLPRGLVLLVSGQNLLNYQLGEPDNITVSPGRTFSVGIRASF